MRRVSPRWPRGSASGSPRGRRDRHRGPGRVPGSSPTPTAAAARPCRPRRRGPLALCRTRSTGSEARVMVVGAMSGPLGGDRLTPVRPGGGGRPAARRLGRRRIAPAGPGQGRRPLRRPARCRRRAELRWLPEQLISADGSDLYVTTRAELAAGAGSCCARSGCWAGPEPPGRLTSRLTVRVADPHRAGPGAELRPRRTRRRRRTARRSSPVTGRWANSSSCVPSSRSIRCRRRCWGECAAVVPLPGPAALVSAVAPDALRLRRLLDAALEGLGREALTPLSRTRT